MSAGLGCYRKEGIMWFVGLLAGKVIGGLIGAGVK